MARPLSLLVVEDSAADTELCMYELLRVGFEPSHQRVETADTLVAALKSQAWDLVLADYSMPRFNGMEALRLLRESGRDIPFIIITGSINEETAVECLKSGADDYVLKENLTRLGPAVERSLREYEERRHRRRLEEQLRHAQRIETVGTLANGLAHDSNNLLTAIFGYLEMARAGIAAGSPVHQYLDVIEQAGRQAAGINRALLTFSHHTPAEKQLVAMDKVCRDASTLVARLIPATIVQEWDIPVEPVYVLGDATQIEQVLLNLLVNSRDAMPNGGAVRISLERREVVPVCAFTPVQNGPVPCARLVVSDTGVGMSPDVKQRLFEPFFTTKPRGQGTGLGLAIIHGIVADHGGWIEVASELGEGTTFSVYIPCATVMEGASSSEPDDTLKAPPGTGVLIIEDNDLLRGVMTTVLKEAGYAVLQARDGREGLRILRAERGSIHVVVTDMELPNISGVQCLEQVGAAFPEIKRLLVTGLGGDPKCLSAGQTRQFPVLTKPFEMTRFCRIIGQLARQGSLVGS